MIIYFRQILLFLFFIPTILFAQTEPTTIVTVDKVTGITTQIDREPSGTGGGIVGLGPSQTKRSITKNTKQGKIIYQSHQTYEYHGCLMYLTNWDIISYDTSGAYKTLMLEKINRSEYIIIKTFAKDKKLISETKTHLKEFERQDWMDIADTNY